MDVPELGYRTTDEPHPRGELYVKATNVIPGYFKHPELSAQIFDEDGFYKTGDIMAETRPDRLTYLDRRNNVIKLSQGEFVAVSQARGDLRQQPVHFGRSYLHGSSDQPFLLAVDRAQRGRDRRRDAPGADRRLAAADRRRRTSLNSYEIPREFLLESAAVSPATTGCCPGSASCCAPHSRAITGNASRRCTPTSPPGQENQVDELRAAAARPVHHRHRAAGRRRHPRRVRPPRTSRADDSRFVELGGDSLSAFIVRLTLLEQIYHVACRRQTIVSRHRDLVTIDGVPRRRTRVRRRLGRRSPSVHGRDATVARADELQPGQVHRRRHLAAAQVCCRRSPGRPRHRLD